MSDKDLVTIAPDGVDIVLDRNMFRAGSSAFIPCIDTEKARRQLHDVFGGRKYKIASRVCIDKGLYGVRFWLHGV